MSSHIFCNDKLLWRPRTLHQCEKEAGVADLISICSGKFDHFDHHECDSIEENKSKFQFGKEPPPLYAWWQALMSYLAIVSFLFDFGSDIWLIITYFNTGDVNWATLTVIFVAVPSLVMTSFSLVWYRADVTAGLENRQSSYKWAFRIVLHILQLGPIARYADVLIYGYRSRNASLSSTRRRYFYLLMVFQEADCSMLRLIECFLEAAPQLLLQLYIMAIKSPGIVEIRSNFSSSNAAQLNYLLGGNVNITLILQVVSCVTSLFSLAMAMVAYYSALRLSRHDKQDVSWPGMATMFIWKLIDIGVRILSLALFASLFHYWLFVLLAAHWLLMMVWIITQRTNFCTGRLRQVKELFYNFVLAGISCFTFFNAKEGRTRWRFVFYYVVCYFENATMLLLWHWKLTQIFAKDAACCQRVWYHLPSLIGVLAGWFLSLALMILFYRFFHPTGPISLCRSDASTLFSANIGVELAPSGAAAATSTDASSVITNDHSLLQQKNSIVAQPKLTFITTM